MPFEVKYGNPYAVPGVGAGISNAALAEKSFARRIENAKLALAARNLDLQQSRDIMARDQSATNNEYKQKFLAHQEDVRLENIRREDARIAAATARQDFLLSGERAYSDNRLSEARTYNENRAVETQKANDARNAQDWANQLTVGGGITDEAMKADPDKYAGYRQVKHPATGQIMHVPTESMQTAKKLRETFRINQELAADQEMNPREITNKMIAADKNQMENINKRMEEIQKELPKLDKYEEAQNSTAYTDTVAEIKDLEKNLPWRDSEKKQTDLKEITRLKNKLETIKKEYINPHSDKSRELADLKQMSDSIQSRMRDPKTYSQISETRQKATEFLKTNERNFTPDDNMLFQGAIANLGGANWQIALDVLNAKMRSGSPVKNTAANNKKTSVPVIEPDRAEPPVSVPEINKPNNTISGKPTIELPVLSEYKLKYFKDKIAYMNPGRIAKTLGITEGQVDLLKQKLQSDEKTDRQEKLWKNALRQAPSMKKQDILDFYGEFKAIPGGLANAVGIPVLLKKYGLDRDNAEKLIWIISKLNG